MAQSRPAVQLMKQILSPEQLVRYPALGKYIEDGGSIFPLVEKGAQGLVREFNLPLDDARRFLRRCNSMALYVRRQFIEHSLYGIGTDTRAAGARDGLLSMVKGPSFDELFRPKFDEMCPPQALESLTSPVAYLIELMKWIEKRIESVAVVGESMPLHERRKDLKLLPVDFNAVHRPVSAVDVILLVLETFIKEHPASEDKASVDLEEAMVQARYPNGLPYYQHWISVDTVTRHHGLSVGDFAHKVDGSFPYFLQPQAWDNDAGRALAHASRLGPYQRKLLTEDPAALDVKESFYAENFGTDNTYKYTNLNQIEFFGERTKLDTPGLEALLSVRRFAPVRSANVSVYPTANAEDLESYRSGSVYLHANKLPVVKITGSDESESFLHRLTLDPDDADDFERFDRMNRKVRLDQWLALPSEQVDALLAAAINAEARGDESQEKSEEDWWITPQVEHALGLFQSLRERYGCTAPDFAVFIDALSIYGRGETLSQFDQIFNLQDDYREPLKLDGGLFAVLPEPEELDLTVAQLCSALNIDLKTYAYLAQAVAGAYGIEDGKLPRSPQVLSSFYRLVKFPRLLGITPVEGVLLLSLLGEEAWLNGVAGVPRIGSADGMPDVLNLLYAMQECTQWCAERDIPVSWILQQLLPPRVLTATNAEGELFKQILNLLPGALFTDSAFLMAGVPALVGGSWVDLLTVLVDADGLVIASALTEADYLAFAREKLDDAVRDGLGEAFEPERPAIVETMLSVLLQIRESQVSVVKESLAAYAGVDSGRMIHLLTWANTTVHQLLRLVLGHVDLQTEDFHTWRNVQPDPLLFLLADIRRRGAVVQKLALGEELLQDYLEYGYMAWLPGSVDKYALTIRTVYYLASLTHAFELSEQPPQKLLDYLREVNALRLESMGTDALKLAQEASSIRLAEFFNWSVQEVRECVSHIEPSKKVLKDLVQLDWLLRVRELAARTGMDALTIFLIGTLPENLNKSAYKDAADHALLSMSESNAPAVTFSEDLKQLVTLSITADKTEAVPNKPGEKIIFTLMLKDRSGEPLSGVHINWSATLGTFQGSAATDPDGKVEMEFTPGKVMGSDTPQFWVDLFEPQYGPTVNLVADVSTLTFALRLKSPVPLAEVPYGQEVELYATLIDRYGNLGKNALVQWLSEPVDPVQKTALVIRPRQGLTNEDGQTRVFVSSPTGGKFDVSVLSEASSAQADFESITFASEE